MSNQTLTVFLGDVDQSLELAAKSYDPQAQLIDHSNYEKFLKIGTAYCSTIYTSLGDLPKNLEIIFKILSQATKIVYCPPAVWSDRRPVDFADPCSSNQGLTETLLRLLPDSVVVEGLSNAVPDPMPLVDQRKSDWPQLWNVGCSISHGAGVSLQQRYGQLLSDELNMPCSFLTMRGSAIDWAASQILRSDVRSKDLVIWGVTSPQRLTYIINNRLLGGITPTSYQIDPGLKHIVDPANLYSQDTSYKHLYAIQQVINFCKKCHASLILVDILAGSHSLLEFLKSQKNYVQIPYQFQSNEQSILKQFIDIGSDNIHPGPQQHQQYKQLILDKLNQLNLI